jgi:hypothetical protein
MALVAGQYRGYMGNGGTFRELLAVERIGVVHGGVSGAVGWNMGRGYQWRRRMELRVGCRRWSM